MEPFVVLGFSGFEPQTFREIEHSKSITVDVHFQMTDSACKLVFLLGFSVNKA